MSCLQTLAACLQGLHANLSTPTALQIGARPFDEATLFEIGYAYEQLVSAVLCVTCWLHPTLQAAGVPELLQVTRTQSRGSQGSRCYVPDTGTCS